MPVKAYLFLVLTTLAWGGNSVAGKMAVGHVSPMMLTLLRWGIAFAVILAISLPQLKKDWPVIRKSWPLLFFFGAFGFAIFNGLLYSALQFTSAINAVIEQASMPAVIFIANFLLFRTAVGLGQIAGFLLTIVGVMLTAAHGDLLTIFSLDLNIGDALVLMAVLVYAVYTISLRWKPVLHWKSLMAVPALAALITSVPMALAEAGQGRSILPDFEGWMIVLYAGLIPSLMSQVLYIRGVELIGANRAGLFINLIPIFGTILAVLLAGEVPHLYHLVSLLLVICGIVLAEWGKARRAET
jgi:drug/metabolite transporter (DMT)-like permease